MSVKRSRDEGIEELLEATGGFGWFQVATTSCLLYNKLISGFSVMMMAFAGQIPSWTCEGSPGSDPTTWVVKGCHVISNVTGQAEECYAYNFTGDQRTMVTEWSLVCGDADVKKDVTSIQMGGLLAGALLAGQAGDMFGRRRTTYAFVLLHGVLNIVTAFAGSWQVFAVCRFFIGVGIGGILVTAFTLSLEFMPTRWRAVCASLPVWAIGVSALALTAWRTPDWKDLHLICGALALPGVLGYWFVPESPRWLTVKDRLEEAEAVIARIARTNGQPMPQQTSEVLNAVSKQEMEARENQARYTYLDILRDFHTAKITIILCFQWFSFSLISYGISFGISALAGNLYLNIFLGGSLVIPLLVIVFFTNNKFGRKATALPLLVIACGASFACLALQKTNGSEQWITGLSLTAKTGMGAAWAVLQTWGTEIYPTVTRNLGYGAANTFARVGGILAPRVIDFDNHMVTSYIIIGVFLAVDAATLLLLPETKGTALADSLTTGSHGHAADTPKDALGHQGGGSEKAENGQAGGQPPQADGHSLHGGSDEGTFNDRSNKGQSATTGPHNNYGSTIQLTENAPVHIQPEGEGAQVNAAFSNDNMGSTGAGILSPPEMTRL